MSSFSNSLRKLFGKSKIDFLNAPARSELQQRKIFVVFGKSKIYNNGKSLTNQKIKIKHILPKPIKRSLHAECKIWTKYSYTLYIIIKSDYYFKNVHYTTVHKYINYNKKTFTSKLSCDGV